MLCSHLLHVFYVDSHSSFRVFDREAEGEAYASVKKLILTDADVNILGQPNLHFEPQVRLCSKYTHFLEGGVRVGCSFVLIGCCSAWTSLRIVTHSVFDSKSSFWLFYPTSHHNYCQNASCPIFCCHLGVHCEKLAVKPFHNVLHKSNS